MGPTRPLLVLLVLLLPLLAGCTTTDRDGADGDGEDPDQSPGPSESPGQASPTPSARPVPPGEQRVEGDEDVDRPGEYAVLPRAEDHTDASWSVPAWNVGDTWVFEHRVTAAAVTVATEEQVASTGTSWDTEVYTIERTERDCQRQDGQCTRTINFTQEDLVELSDDGYVEHSLVFPLEDGKRWVYARDDGKGGVTKVYAEARHVPDYLWPNTTKTVEAWRIILDYEGDGNVQTKTWVGVDQKNMLRREIWADGTDGVPVMHFATTLRSYTPA